MSRIGDRFEIRLEGETRSFRPVDKKAFISLDVMGRELGEPSNWLDVTITALCGSFYNHTAATLETCDFEVLQRVLQSLVSGKRKKAEFVPIEPWIRMSFRVEKEQRVLVQGKLYDELGSAHYLHFCYWTPLSQIEAVIKSCERLILAYPSLDSRHVKKSDLVRKRTSLDLSISGLAYARVQNFPAVVTHSGIKYFSFFDTQKAMQAAARAVVEKGIPIRGHEALFLRRSLALEIEELATELGVAEALVQEWETFQDKRLPGAYEVALRSFCAECWNIELPGTFHALKGKGIAPARLIVQMPKRRGSPHCKLKGKNTRIRKRK